MATFNAGEVRGGEYLDGQLLVNDVNLGAMAVQSDDGDSTLRDAISSVADVSASLDSENNLIISSGSTILITGARPCGVDNGTVRGLHPGGYE